MDACRTDDLKIDEDVMREAQGKRTVIDKVTGKAKEVDIYDRPEPTKKKAADPEKARGMLSSNVEQSIIPEGTSK